MLGRQGLNGPEPSGAVERLTAADGFSFDAWREPPREARRGGLVIAHAIWGVTPHLRALAADFAEAGWEVLIPSLFDRFRPGIPERDTEPAEFNLRMGWAAQTGCLPDMAAAIAALQPPVCVIGFCFGGTVAWLSACRLEGIAATVSFYGGAVFDFRQETPRCPTMLHFGKDDPMIPPEQVKAISVVHEGLPIHLYPAGHGFVGPSGFHEDSAELALLRTRAFLHRATAPRGETP